MEDWSDLLPLLFALLAVIGFPLALRSRKKGGPEKVEELHRHLLIIGIRADRLEEGDGQIKAGGKRSRGRGAVGAIKLKGKNIDSINVIGVASQYGVRYFLDFLVMSFSMMGKESKKKTRLIKKKSSSVLGKTIEIDWKGNDYLARKLSLDYQIKDKLSQADAGILKGGITIFPEPKLGYTRIRTTYFLPTPDLLEAMDIIAKHIKAGQ